VYFQPARAIIPTAGAKQSPVCRWPTCNLGLRKLASGLLPLSPTAGRADSTLAVHGRTAQWLVNVKLAGVNPSELIVTLIVPGTIVD